MLKRWTFASNGNVEWTRTLPANVNASICLTIDGENFGALFFGCGNQLFARFCVGEEAPGRCAFRGQRTWKAAPIRLSRRELLPPPTILATKTTA